MFILVEKSTFVSRFMGLEEKVAITVCGSAVIVAVCHSDADHWVISEFHVVTNCNWQRPFFCN